MVTATIQAPGTTAQTLMHLPPPCATGRLSVIPLIIRVSACIITVSIFVTTTTTTAHTNRDASILTCIMEAADGAPMNTHALTTPIHAIQCVDKSTTATTLMCGTATINMKSYITIAAPTTTSACHGYIVSASIAPMYRTAPIRQHNTNMLAPFLTPLSHFMSSIPI